MADYVSQSGDTFDLIARKKYGTETEAGRIEAANPGVSEPIPAGTVIYVPFVRTDSAQKIPADNPNETAVLINGTRFRFWESLSVTLALDSFSSVNLTAPFDPDAPGFKDTFRPFSYAPLVATIGGETVFTGRMMGIDPTLSSERRSINVSGYSEQAVLNDCTAPASALPLEWDESTLETIAAALVKPFGFNVSFSESPGPIFDRVEYDPASTVLSFLAGLAAKRGFVIGGSVDGRTVTFTRSVSAGSPVVALKTGTSPLMSVTPAFNPQAYFSHLTGVDSVMVGFPGGQLTVKNPLVSGILRPHSFTVEDSELQTEVNDKMGRMIGNMASYSIDVATWRDPSGALWSPNTTLKLYAPGAMIYSEYEFIIRSVTFNRDRTNETATLGLVLPGAFSGKIPGALPWD